MIDALPLLLGPEGYQISRSVRLRSSASAYFNRTFGTATNTLIWTWSAWVKRGALGGVGPYLFEGFSNGTNRAAIVFANTDALQFFYLSGGVVVSQLITTQVFRDPSAWYHIVVAYDAAQATASNRLKFYINGTQVTAFSTATYPSLNQATWINTNSAPHYLGTTNATTGYNFDGYLTEINFIDGQALTPASFGETNTVTGVWQPKKYAGTYGTNGFYLNFSDNSGVTATTIGKDSSGNGNNWTPNNISVTAGVTYDSMLDVPTQWADGGNGRGNYAVLNALEARSNRITPIDGNLSLQLASGSNAYFGSPANFQITSGKWYWEVNIGVIHSGAGQWMDVGIINAPLAWPTGSYAGANNGGFVYLNDGWRGTGGGGSPSTSSAYGASWTTGDVIGVAFDADAGTLAFYKNGVSQGTAFSSIGGIPNGYIPCFEFYRSTTTTQTMFPNFGQRPFSYTPPSGFKALNTLNLPTPTILKGNQYFDATLYTGNGTGITVTNSGSMQPDFVWAKNRSNVADHALYDALRTAMLSSNTTAAEVAASNVVSYNSNGFTISGGDSRLNANGNTYVGWQWKEGATQGFDIVTYTGTGANRTVAHNLGVAPNFIILKCRSNATNWFVGGSNIAAAGNGTWSSVMEGLNTTSAVNTGATAVFNSTAPTSSVFSLGTELNANGSGRTFVAYLFAEVAGFSKFGSYTGNGSADGPFVFCGFRPMYVLIKNATGTAGANTGWYIFDAARNTFNTVSNSLRADLSSAEVGGYAVDFVSNGFKLRISDVGINSSAGATHIFAAFAENPFKNALAR